MTKQDDSTKPKRDKPEDPIQKTPATAKQPEYHRPQTPGSASGDPTE